MKACKIILIVLLVLKSLIKLGEAFAQSDDKQLERLVIAIAGISAMWLLYKGAGVLDV